MLTKSLLRAASDPELRGAPLQVLLFLTLGDAPALDPVEFKPVKIASLAASLHLKPVTTAWAVQRLVEGGYLRQGVKCDRVNTYRLVWDARKESASKDLADADKAA